MKKLRLESEMKPCVVSAQEAAIYFQKSSSQIRRWVQEGCPTVREGCSRKGRGMLLNLQEVERWYSERHHLPTVRSRSVQDSLEKLGQLMWDSTKRASGPGGKPIHEILGIPAGKIAAFLVLAYEYAFRREFGRDPWEAELPEPIMRLCDIARAHARDGRVQLDR